ncbi:hypothetical protein E5340_05625 [Ligilactobacillus murinus]|uniref:Capsid protein n=1 Tax=Ligilactobacillus murinus TaxID=1622 RepID=A0A4S2EHQ3_9LACO|nr:hypothetical protein [Ligilactobacillus murinus]TGY55486.1 hypothetical protein E5340_05625 [Ligilactobacillus murinus]
MATFNYVEKDGAMLDQKITEGLMTTVIGNADVNLVNGGKSFTLRTISTSGLKNHTRGKGYNEGTITDSKKVYTMGQDRDVEFFIDRQDVDETNQELAMANISNVFITEHVQPELDAYRFSTMVKAAQGTGQVGSTKLTKSNVYGAIKDAIMPLRKYGPQNIVGFVSSDTMNKLEQSTAFTRTITDQNVAGTALNSRIASIDGIQLIEIWDGSRFMSDYDFSDGFKATESAENIDFMFVSKPSVIQVVKENAVYLFAPGEHTEGDGYLYQNRLYHDLFVLDSRKDGIVANLSKADTTSQANG